MFIQVLRKEQSLESKGGVEIRKGRRKMGGKEKKKGKKRRREERRKGWRQAGMQGGRRT